MNTQQVILQHLTTLPVMPAPSLHVAIITDGNGRWATHRGLPRSAGHRRKVDAAGAKPCATIRTNGKFCDFATRHEQDQEQSRPDP